jgi:uncharacterized membrane protein
MGPKETKRGLQRTPEDDGYVKPDGTVLLDKTVDRVTSACIAGSMIGMGVGEMFMHVPLPGCSAAEIAAGAFIAGAAMSRIRIENSRKRKK